MKLTGDCGINLYAGYERLLKKEKKGDNSRGKSWIPLVLLAAVMAGIGGYLLLENMGREARIKAVQADIAALEPAYTVAQQLTDTYDAVDSAYQNLMAANLLFGLNPVLTRSIVERVQTCAGTIFLINSYSYDERTGALVISAEADSVNDVPGFIQRLRNTELFSTVQYTGYTSDTTGKYYCTVGCTLTSALLEAFSEVEPGEDLPDAQTQQSGSTLDQLESIA